MSTTHEPASVGCEHGWHTESRHRTSAGVVRYVRCVACGARRVDVETSDGMPPGAVTVTVPRERDVAAEPTIAVERRSR